MDLALYVILVVAVLSVAIPVECAPKEDSLSTDEGCFNVWPDSTCEAVKGLGLCTSNNEMGTNCTKSCGHCGGSGNGAGGSGGTGCTDKSEDCQTWAKYCHYKGVTIDRKPLHMLCPKHATNVVAYVLVTL